MIGVFDSGYGGLTVLKELVNELPEYDYIYLGDNAREPYGPHPEDEIFEFTKEGVEFLFNQGCNLVLLACNTVSAGALRRLQKEVLPKKYPMNKVLGILVPTIEEVTGIPWRSPERIKIFESKQSVIGIFGTEATVKSGAYTREIAKRDPNIQVFEQACPDLTTLIVAEGSDEEILEAIHRYKEELHKQFRKAEIDKSSDLTLVLGCTHYTLIKDLIRQELPDNIKMIDQSEIVAEKLKYYLNRHPDLEKRIKKDSGRRYLTTGDPETVTRIGSKFYGSNIEFEKISL